MRNDPAPQSILVSAVLLLAMGAVFYAGRGDPPPKDQLGTSSGPVSYVEGVYRKGDLKSVRFGLEGDARNFHYHSKLGSERLVIEALQSNRGSQVSVLFNADEAGSPWFDERSFHTVFEIQVRGDTVRSYEDVLASWRADNLLGERVSYGLASGAILMLVIWLVNSKRPVTPPSW